MQLKKKDTRPGLVAATLGLLGAAAPAGAADGGGWDFDTGVLVYQEGGGRVQAVEPVLDATHKLDSDRTFSVKIVLDTLSGASPTGAAPSPRPQTFSGPSGTGAGTTTPANELPVDPNFKDQRVALTAGYSFPFFGGSLGLGGNASQEHDFTSGSGSVHYSLDLFQHNTTLSAGANYESDTINPVGGAPTPLSVKVMGGSTSTGGGEGFDGGEGGAGGGVPAGPNESKKVVDLVAGITQVLSPSSLVQFNYSISASRGYHTDPYKILSVVDASGVPLRYVYESRPLERNKRALFARFKSFLFAQDVFDLSYRYMTDDWAIRSHTIDATYRWNFSERNFVEPHVRGYAQNAAEFFHAALFDGQETTVAFASADPRLGAFRAYTGGLKLGHTLDSGSQLSVRLEYYKQFGKRVGVPEQAAAALAQEKLEPDLTAAMVTLGYRFKW